MDSINGPIRKRFGKILSSQGVFLHGVAVTSWPRSVEWPGEQAEFGELLVNPATKDNPRCE